MQTGKFRGASGFRPRCYGTQQGSPPHGTGARLRQGCHYCDPMLSGRRRLAPALPSARRGTFFPQADRMLSKLSSQQEAGLSECRDRWFDFATSKRQATPTEIRRAVDSAYQCTGLPGYPPPRVILHALSFADGVPLATALCYRRDLRWDIRYEALAHAKQHLSQHVAVTIRDRVRLFFKEAFRPHKTNWRPFWPKIHDHPGVFANKTREVASHELMRHRYRLALTQGHSPEQLIEYSLFGAIESANRFPSPGEYLNLDKMVLAILHQSSNLTDYLDAAELAYFWYFHKYCNIDLSPYLAGLWALARHVGWCWCYDDICIVTPRPTQASTEIRLRGRAVAYGENWERYYLDGMPAPAWLVTTPGDQIDPRKILDRSVANVTLRREFVRKVGLERIYHALKGETLDEKIIHLKAADKTLWPCQYKLTRLDFGHGFRCNVLVMPNASLPDLWHVEYVPWHCSTIEEAMNFRLGRSEDDVDDVEGEDWYLHGDVVITPQGAKKLKRWPTLIA